MIGNNLLEDYSIFKKLHHDSMGLNFRVGEVKNDRFGSHKVMVRLHSFLSKEPEYLEMVKNRSMETRAAEITGLCTPEQVICQGQNGFLVYPCMQGKTLDRVFEDSKKKEIPMKFGMAFSLALEIAGILEQASRIDFMNGKSFHGFLTPDSILLDYQGQVHLKYYGLWLSREESEEAVAEMVKKYGPWLSPEFIKGRNLVPATDLYYLGYLVYAMLTGSYFTSLPGEDFDSAFTNISFSSNLPSMDKNFLIGLINFFKKTLHPDPSKRFKDLGEFTAYIQEHFDLAKPESFNESMATYMKLLYHDIQKKEQEVLGKELASRVGDVGSARIANGDDEFFENIPLALHEARPSKVKFLVTAAVLIVVVGVGSFLVIKQSNKAREEQQIASKMLEEQSREKEEFKRKLDEVQQKLAALETTKTETSEEQEAKEKEIERLKKLKKEQEKKQALRLNSLKENASPKESIEKEPALVNEVKEAAAHRTPTTDSTPQDALEPAKDAETQITNEPGSETTESEKPGTKPAPSPIPLVALAELTQKPVKISGSQPGFSPALKRTYAGRRATVKAMLLVDHKGNVIDVKIETNIPSDIKDAIIDNYKKWKYKPGLKGDILVKVWLPVKYKLFFKF